MKSKELKLTEGMLVKFYHNAFKKQFYGVVCRNEYGLYIAYADPTAKEYGGCTIDYAKSLVIVETDDDYVKASEAIKYYATKEAERRLLNENYNKGQELNRTSLR